MQITEYSCPNCGATIKLSGLRTHGTCEYCGSEYLIDPSGKQKPDTGKTYTESVLERIESEKKERAANQPEASSGEESWEKTARNIVLGLIGAGTVASLTRRIRRRVVNFLVLFLLFLLCGIVGYVGMMFLPAAYLMYALVGAGVLSLCGLILLFSTRSRRRSALLGLGIGALAYLIPALFL